MLISENTQPLNLSISQSILLALSLSVVLFISVSTNLRISGLPVGAGEIGLLLLMAATIFLKPWQSVSSPLFLFWLAVWVCTALGYMFGSVIGNLRLHNAVAYAYTGLLTLAFVTVFSRLRAPDLRRILFCFIVISVLALWLGFIAYISLDQQTLELLRIDSMNDRYQGWCQNANQMSLLLVPTPFLVLYLWFTSSKTTLQDMSWALLLLLSVTMGFIVRSDALGFSWILGLILLVGVSVRNRGWITGKNLIAVLLMFFIGFMGVRLPAERGWLGGLTAKNSLYVKENVLEKLRVGHGETDQKVSIRQQLWSNALEVWERSPIVGHGPGAYSNFDSGSEIFIGIEAHNTLIDLMVQGGIFLAIAYFALFFWLMLSLWRSKQWLLLVSALMIFSFEFFMFHLRQPVLWFYLTIMLILAQKGAKIGAK